MEQSERDVISNLRILRTIQKDESSRETKDTKDAKESKDESREADKAGSSTTEELQLSSEDDEFYHGLIPKEDLPFLLKEVGDFITRTTQGSGADGRRVLVISVKILPIRCQKSFRHIVVRVNKTDGKYEWKAYENMTFNSLKELIDFYITAKRPLLPDVKESILIRGIKQQSWEFRNSDVKLKGVLGTGQFGDVRAGEIVIDGKLKKVAIKLGKEDRSGRQLSREQLKEMMHESRLMRLFKHENVLRTYGIAVFKEPIMIILELVKGGCILEVLRLRKRHISEAEKVGYMCLGTAQGLAYLHAHKCIHRDIAARNVLYTRDRVAKISDFGLSRMGECYMVTRSKKIPLRWTAPEVFSAFRFTAKSDVFAFAIFMWEVLSDGEEPYKHLTNIEVRRMVEKGKRLEKPKRCSDETFSIVEKCWAPNPDSRCSMKEVVKYLKELHEKQPKESQPLIDVERGSNEDVTASQKIFSSSRRTHRRRGNCKRSNGNRVDLSDVTSSARHRRLAGITSVRLLRRRTRTNAPKECIEESTGRKASLAEVSFGSKDSSNDRTTDPKERSSDSRNRCDDERKPEPRLRSRSVL